MSHTKEYKKGELAELKKKGVKPGTKKAHQFVSDLRKRRKIPTTSGVLYS